MTAGDPEGPDGARDPFEQVMFDEDFVRGASFVEPDHRTRTKQAKRDAKTSRRASRRTSRRSRWAGRAPTVVLVVLVSVTVVALCATIYLASGEGTSSGTAGSGPNDVEVVARRYDPGECVWWEPDDDDPSRGSKVVPCDEPHQIEIVMTIDVGDRLGEEFPSDEAFAGVLESDCEQPADDYAGTELLDTSYMASLFVPTESSWKQGSRLMSCGIEGSRLPGEPAPMLERPIRDLIALPPSTTTTR